MDAITRDLRYAVRLLRKNPGFAAIAILTLALGIGGTTTVFSVVHAVLLRALPYRDPGRLVLAWTKSEKGAFLRGDTSGPDFLDWRERNRSFEDMAACWPLPVTWTGAAEPEKLRGAVVTANLLDLLGVRASIGRAFVGTDASGAAERVVALGHGLWQRRFGADPAVLGRSLTLNGKVYEIVGVLPSELEFPSAGVDVFLPLPAESPIFRERGEYLLGVVGRLKRGVSIEAAQSDMDGIAARLAEEHPESNRSKGVFLAPMQREVVGPVRSALLVLLGAVTFLLLIACANVVSLLLGRALDRRKEMAARVALGAGRIRIFRQLLVEGALLALLGGGAGVVLSVWGVDAIVSLGEGRIPRQHEIGVDLSVLGFALLASLTIAVVFGLLPALQVFRTEIQAPLRHRPGRMRSALLVLEVASCLVLLVGATLMVRSLVRLLDVDPGFRPAGLIAAKIVLPEARYSDNARQLAFARSLLEQARSMPGVDGAGIVSHLPLEGDYWRYGITLDDRPDPKGAAEPDRPHAAYRLASPDYFSTLGIPTLAGRTFTDEDRDGSPRVLVVNAAMTRRFWPAESPIGRRVRFSFCPSGCDIVGVVGDVKHFGLDQSEEPAMYGAYEQKPEAFMNELSLVLRSRSDASALVHGLKREVATLDPALPLSSVATMEERISLSSAPRRTLALVLSGFALTALILAAIGVYGVLSHLVRGRTREIGIRMALGARAGDVVRIVVGDGLRPVVVGGLVGAGAALGMTRSLRSFVFGVTTSDPVTYGGVVLLLLAVALAAAYFPVRRATRVDPAVTLRCE